MTEGAQALRWDASFPSLRLNGSGCRQFLHGQTSAAIDQAPDHQLIRSCWLTATGRVQALLEVRLDPEGAEVLVLCGDAEAVLTGFDRVIFPADRVKIAQSGHRRRLQRLRQAPQPLRWDQDVLWLAGTSLPSDWEILNLASREQLEHWRLSHGLPFSNHELNGDTNPLELGLGDWVSLDKGCYLGQETMAKLASRDGVKQKLRCWTVQAAGALSTCPEIGDTLRHNGERAGTITSALQEGNSWRGLALIRRGALQQPSLELSTGSQAVSLDEPPAFQECGGTQVS
ncbi:folate-binding protein YgfZ [Synechococcus sp. UW140]|uniref:CAF17-like 4Fe-4S cluster assembly/insertion protein YgfZ n=1 Tax=Synechococcus sp. UW140 TaxID=368503 RepID=UPI000E0EE07A|nr:glycine cleavage T-protein [Synechococcus sp. UW140]